MTANEPREIAFEDIREGDDIEAQWRVGDTLETRRGVAHEKEDEEFWVSKEGRVLVGSLGDQVRILLHHRPTPTEPEGLGAVVRTDEGVEYVSVNRMPGTPRWVDAGVHETSGRRALRWTELRKCTSGIEVDQ